MDRIKELENDGVIFHGLSLTFDMLRPATDVVSCERESRFVPVATRAARIAALKNLVVDLPYGKRITMHLGELPTEQVIERCS